MKTDSQPVIELGPSVGDVLEDFVAWYLKTFGGVPPSPHDGVGYVGKFSLLTFYRQKEFQVQLTICKPNSRIPDHAHPNVDTMVSYVCGELYFRVDGKEVFKPEDIFQTEDGRTSKNFKFMRVKPGQMHGATIGDKGAAFITFQRWLSGTPKSVELDWDGPPLSKEHSERELYT
jgi:hypothetical protein